MNLRELAEKDLAITLEDAVSGGSCEMVFIDPEEKNYRFNGRVGDIGYLLDTDGVPVAGRCVCVEWRMSSLKKDDENPIEPGRGWVLEYVDLSGKKWQLFVTRFEPDRTLGIGRVWLSLNLETKQ